MYTLSTFNTEHLQKIVKKLATMLYMSVLNGWCEHSRNNFDENINLYFSTFLILKRYKVYVGRPTAESISSP